MKNNFVKILKKSNFNLFYQSLISEYKTYLLVLFFDILLLASIALLGKIFERAFAFLAQSSNNLIAALFLFIVFLYGTILAYTYFKTTIIKILAPIYKTKLVQSKDKYYFFKLSFFNLGLIVIFFAAFFAMNWAISYLVKEDYLRIFRDIIFVLLLLKFYVFSNLVQINYLKTNSNNSFFELSHLKKIKSYSFLLYNLVFLIVGVLLSKIIYYIFSFTSLLSIYNLTINGLSFLIIYLFFNFNRFFFFKQVN